ncbi:TIGR04376 family protein [Alkalinema sp. FACHB-956]|uniref:TIGR04376 family protein n=1 Tax=Alkalinema sp. FACHB-956 TaxID=2692768 RepID=UPI0016830D53|nr:TIGR04376 family protein [Alkalinema sp. FACHB-956]MBD2326180.1 TIGR04376 family protein [Alkalinema sp. FACHB-956]
MGLFDDVSQFLEDRIDEFLKNNPHLELQALEEKLYQQEQETGRLLADLRSRIQQVEQKIRETAQDVQRWHVRIEKAKAANRRDLAEPAQAHEASLIRTGNQLWGQMELLRDRVKQTEELQKKIQGQRQEVKAKLEQVQAQQATQRAAQPNPAPNATWKATWNQIPRMNVNPADPLEKQFQNWEAEEELQQLKRKMGQ